jgi:hypothetical protein
VEELGRRVVYNVGCKVGAFAGGKLAQVQVTQVISAIGRSPIVFEIGR